MHLISYCWLSVSDCVLFVLHTLWLCQLHVMIRCLQQLMLFTAKLSLSVSPISHCLCVVVFTVLLPVSSVLLACLAPKKKHSDENYLYV